MRTRIIVLALLVAVGVGPWVSPPALALPPSGYFTVLVFDEGGPVREVGTLLFMDNGRYYAYWTFAQTTSYGYWEVSKDYGLGGCLWEAWEAYGSPATIDEMEGVYSRYYPSCCAFLIGTAEDKQYRDYRLFGRNW